jgi:methionine-rich copper-binding protein CopC
MVTSMSLTKLINLRGASPALALLAGAALTTPGAFAHAFLDHATPAVGSTVHGSPGDVKVWFTQELEPAFSNLQVVDQNGAQVDKKNNAIDAGDKTLLKVSLPGLPPGKYKVVYHVLSVDTHTTDGTFTFEVAP